MSLTWQMNILTGYGRCEICFKFWTRHCSKFYRLCDETGYTYDMVVYMGRTGQSSTQHLTAVHATMSEMTLKIQGCGHKQYMDSYFPPQTCSMTWPWHTFTIVALSDATRRACHRTGPKKMRLKQGNIQGRSRGELTETLEGQFMVTQQTVISAIIMGR